MVVETGPTGRGWGHRGGDDLRTERLTLRCHRLLAAALTVLAAAALAVGAALGIVALLDATPDQPNTPIDHVRASRTRGVDRSDARGRRAGPLAARSAWHDVPPPPGPAVRRARAWPRRPRSPRRSCGRSAASTPHLPLVLDESGEPMALVGIRRAIEVFVQHLEQSEGRPTRPAGRLPGVRPRRGPARPQPRLAPGHLPHGRTAGLAPFRRDRPAGRDPAARDVRTRRRRVTSIWTDWSTSPCAATPRPRPGRPASGCASSAG